MGAVKGKVIGIDLGTTYSAVAVFDERRGDFVIVPSRTGGPTTPSVVGFANGEVVVGEAAKKRLAMDPDNTVAEIKRHMGEPFRDERGEPKLDPAGLPIPYTVRFAGRVCGPQEISAYILKELKALAEEHLKEPVRAAVITVPAYFTGGPRTATEEAGALAGLDVKLVLKEPTAAAVAFGHAQLRTDEDDETTRRVLVYDLGGGTFDVSVIEIAGETVEVRGVGGDHYLGGVDFDRAIVKWAVERIRAEHGVDLEHPEGPAAAELREAYARVASAAEGLKIALSVQTTATLALSFLFQHPETHQKVNIEYDLTRNEFLSLVTPLLKKTLVTVDETLDRLKLTRADIHDVLLVGGSTRMPRVRELVERHFGRKPRTDVNPDECVAMGAAIMAVKYVDTSASEAPPDVPDIDVSDVTSHSLGVREGEDNMDVLIPIDTRIPKSVEKIYVPGEDFQRQVTVAVFQGEHRVASANTLLTQFDVTDLPALPRDQVKIRIRFTLDVNDVLRVTATDLVNGQERTVDVKYGKGAGPAGGLLPLGGPGQRPQTAPARSTDANREPAVPPEFATIVKKARELLTGPAAGSERDQLQAALASYLGALRAGNAQAADDAGNALMELVFDLMPV
jgi:molecular chaperone DnaK